MKRALYTGSFRFPDGDAAASRVYSVAKLMENEGYVVSFAGWEKSTSADGHYQHEGHDCFPQGEFREEHRNPIARLKGFLLRGGKTIKWLRENHQFDVVVAYNPPALFMLFMLFACKRWNMRLILDNTEWYEAEHLPGGPRGIAALENWIRMRLIYPRVRNIICISRYLFKYYANRNVINIPPLSSPRQPHYNINDISSAICFLYAGEAGKKDRLGPFVAALPTLQKTLGRKILLRVAGMNRDNLQKLLEEEQIDPDLHLRFVECYGRVSKEKVADLYQESHFSVLFREHKRYALAGFPTKAVESWAYGCPIILNEVGDVGSMAGNGTDSILVDEAHIARDLSQALERLLISGGYPAMRREAAAKAAAHFLPSVHQRAFSIFMSQLT